MSKTIKTLAALTALATAAGLAYAQNGVNTPSSSQNATQGAVFDGTSTTASPSSVNNTQQSPNANSSTDPQGMRSTGSSTMNNSGTSSSNVNGADASLSTDPASTSRPARADRN